MISMTVGALKHIWTRFVFFCLKMREIDLLIYFAISPKLMVVLSLVRAIAFDAFGLLDTVGQSCMFPSLTVLALRNSWIHIGFSNCCNKPPYIKAPVYKTLSLTATLNVPNVNPNDQHIRLRWNLNDAWFQYKNNIVKNLILFYYVFNIIWCETFVQVVVKKVRNAYNF